MSTHAGIVRRATLHGLKGGSVWMCVLIPTSTGAVTLRQSEVGIDSVAIVETVQAAQRRFERLRRDRLPWTYSSSGRCDIRIGRYCFRFDTGEPTWTPPPEPSEVLSARDALIALLDSAQLAVPGDEWIVTQLIRYLGEIGQLQRARDVAVRCQVKNGWLCPALAGFVAHADGEYERAEAAFDLSLARMTSDQRCEWEDISDLVPGNVRGRIRSLGCEERRTLLDTLLWLADPMYSTPGNEVRTEHFARHMVSLMYQMAKGPDPERWNRNTHQITLRYGAPRGWQRVRGSRSELRASLVTHYGTDGAGFFFPKREYVESPFEIPKHDWVIDVDRPQSNHDPAYAFNGFEDITADFALFRRSDSTLVVATTFLSHDSLPPDVETQFALVMTSGPGAPTYATTLIARDTAASLFLTGPPRGQLVSVEAIAFEHRVAGRTRHGLDLARVHGEGLIVSDVLILDPVDSIPEQLSEAIPHVRRPGLYRAGDRFTLYWELYGIDRTSTVHSTTISLDKTSKGVFRRIAELTPFASHRPAVHVAWEETRRRTAATFQRTLVVDLPDDLSRGDYRLTLTIETPDGRRVQRAMTLIVEN